MEDFLTVDDVAKTLKITRQTVSKFIQKKELNAIKINKNYRLTCKDLEKFLNENSSVSEPETIYLKRSRNCQLDYENKLAESEIMYNQSSGDIKPLFLSHKGNCNKFIFGDNYLILKKIVDEYRNKIDLIYIDPPFGTGQQFADINNQVAYSDKLINSEFLEFLRRRLILLRELLSDTGSIYLHIDKKIGHYVKILMDEIFGYDNFLNDITRIKCNPKNFARNAYGNYSDMILFYAKKKDQNIWNDIREELSTEQLKKLFPKIHPQSGRYTTNPIHAPGETIEGDTGKKWKGLMPPKGRHWRYSRQELTQLDENGLIEWSVTGNPRKKVFANNHSGTKIQDVWEMKDKGLSYVDYPTQKSDLLLERIIKNSSNEDSIVLDCFAGSGNTLITANKLNRKWIGIDNSMFSFETIKNSFAKEKIACNFYEYVPLN